MRTDGVNLLEGSSILNLSVPSSNTYPTSPNVGELFYKLSGPDSGFYCYNGGSWQQIGTADSLAAHIQDTTVHLTVDQNTLLDSLAVSAAELNSLLNITANVQSQLNSKLDMGGGSMTGDLLLANDPTTSLAAATKQYVDATAASAASGVNTSLTLAGDVTGSGTNNVTTTLTNTGIAAGDYTKLTIDTKGRAIAGANPTTLAGYGITDATNKNGDTIIGNLVMTAGTHITVPDTPINDTDVTNKAYVDSKIAGLSWKNQVRVATTGNITLSNTQLIDGVTVAIGDRILVKDQTTTSENGIYVVAASNWVRATDADTGIKLGGAATWVQEGTVNGNTGWTCATDGVITIDSTSITFVQFNGAAGITGGVGLSITGNTLNINLGAGIAQLPTDEVGIDLYTGGGLILTSDGTTSSSSTNSQLALANTGVIANTYGNATNVPTVIIDTKGRITAASNTSIAFPVTSVAGRTGTITLTAADVGLNNVTNSLQVINSGNATSIQAGTLGARPSAGTTGRFYVVATTGTIYYDDGSSWVLLHPAITGDVSIPVGTTAATLANTGIAAGDYTKLTIDTKGRAIAGANPTTLADYGITDAINKNGDTVSGNITFNGTTSVNTQLINGFVYYSKAVVAAAGTTQATAATISSQVIVISSGTGGVILPIPAQAGLIITIINASGASVNVYPNSSHTIDSLAANSPFVLGNDARLSFVSTSTSQWYSLTATYG